MDRFIESLLDKAKLDVIFKIQYGQIYSNQFFALIRQAPIFKIQYGQIYRVEPFCQTFALNVI